MKRIIFLLVTSLFGQFLMAQGSVSMPTSEAFLERIFIDGIKESLNYSEISGSAYADEKFQKTEISGGFKNIQARYNSYKDQVEFKKDNQIFVLDKSDAITRIGFTKSGQNLVLLKLNDVYGYYFELYAKGNKVLLKKIATTIDIPVKSKNSYSSDEGSPSFVTKITYYIGIEGKFYPVPDKRKKIYDVFPDRKAELEAKVKSNQIDVNDEAGLVEFVEIL